LGKLAGFPGLLRRAGIRVSPGETVDFLRSALLLGLDREALVTAALAALAKGETEERVTRKLFDLYFTFSPGELAPAERVPPSVFDNPPRLAAGEFLERLADLRSTIRRELARCKTGAEVAAGGGGAGTGTGRGGVRPDQLPDRLERAFRTGDRGETRALAGYVIREVLEKTGADPVGYDELLRRVKVGLDWAGTVDCLEKEDGDGLPPEGGNIRDFEQILIDELDREIRRRRPEALEEVAGRSDLAGVDFNSLNLRQVEDIKRIVAGMARSLAARLSYRRARSRRGEVDMRRTARLAARTGGVPLILCRRSKIPHRPELVVLCDLSGSVSLCAGFMLQLIYAVQERFTRVRTFAFVDDVAEITEFLKEGEPGEAILRVIREARVARTPFSDYGAVWKEFCFKYMEYLTPKTTVLVLGDARNNWRSPGLEYLEQIRDRSARIIWLNPAPAERWDRDDSIISLYYSYCSKLFECRNLRQLAEAARYLGKL